MHWIIQDNDFKEIGWETLLSVLEKTGASYSIHKVVPFVGELLPDIDIDGPVVCMGSYSLRHVAKAKGWTPGVFDLEPHTYGECIRHWGKEMLNHASYAFALKHIAAVCPDPDEFLFFRPVGDNKNFAGGIWPVSHIMSLYDNVRNLKDDEVYYGLNPDTLIIKSEIVEIYAEYRTWIVDGKVATASQYKLGNRVIYNSDVDEDVIRYATAAAKIWQPERAFVLDVARTPAGLKIVEINTFNAAGFYAGDTYKIFEAIEGMGY